MSKTTLAAVALLCIGVLPQADGRITKIEIASTSEPAPNGYVTIAGVAYGEVDPEHRLNSIIQDLALAPRNARGMVEYSTDFTIHVPQSGGNGVLFQEVVNQGFPLNDLPPYYSRVGALLRERGYTIVHSGWQASLVPMKHPLHHHITVPVATRQGEVITGRIRKEYKVSQPTPSVRLFGGFGVPHLPYEPVDPSGADATLARRVREADPRVEVPQEEWAFAECSEDNPWPGLPSAGHLCLKDGLNPNYLYELIYTAKNPIVFGLGFAATRDLISFLKHASGDDSGTPNPITGSVETAIMQGHSLSSFYMRSFLHLGFNQDEDGQIVFEGMSPCIGPGRAAMNVRFAHSFGTDQHDRHLSAGWESPYNWMPEYDPLAERAGWILERCTGTNTCPKIMQAVSSTEYWKLRASLTTTDALGLTDSWIPRNTRVYLFSSSQHIPAKKVSAGICQQLNNPNDWTYNLRALLVALEQWVVSGTEPPPSQIPTVEAGTLVSSDAPSIGWPGIPGVKYTGLLNALSLVDYGPDFDPEDASGIVREPPVVQSGKDYAVLVSKVDADGNEIAGIRSTTVQAPLGTYTGWNLRREGFSEDEFCGLDGSYIPFAATKAEREAAGDPRLSLEERYGDHEGYVEAVKDSANRLVAQRFLLREDAEEIIKAAEDSDVLVPPETENRAPVAVITPASQTVVAMEVALDGSKSHDPDGDPLEFSWKATGRAVLLMGAETATPRVQFQAGAGDYTFELAVTDDKGATGTATTTVVYMGP